jgi:hypothetical protein
MNALIHRRMVLRTAMAGAAAYTLPSWRSRPGRPGPST